MADDSTGGGSQPSDEGADYESRLRRRLLVLKEELEAGRIRFAPGLKVIESLKSVRYGSDGEIDLSTVDPIVRSLALSAEFMSDRRKLSDAISLQESQNLYFELIEKNFIVFYREMLKHGVSPHDIAKHVSEQTDAVGV